MKNEDKLDKFDPVMFADVFASVDHELTFVEAIEIIHNLSILYHVNLVQEELENLKNDAQKN